jgi:hypothetical protein
MKVAIANNKAGAIKLTLFGSMISSRVYYLAMDKFCRIDWTSWREITPSMRSGSNVSV